MDDLKASIERREFAVKQHIRALPKTMSKGQRALESLSLYRASRLPIPDDVIRKIDNCYRHFIEGKPVSGWVSVEHNNPAPLTLGQAFGVPDIRGGQKSALKRKRLALAGPELVALFTNQHPQSLPRTKDGYEVAGKMLGLTASEVEDWVIKYLAVPRKNNPSP